MAVKIVDGDRVTTDAKYICHQVNGMIEYELGQDYTVELWRL